MGRIAQLVMGPAGTGKSTYCNAMRQHSETLKRVVHCINLDPAAEEFSYPVAVVTLEDVMEGDNYGPNGGLVYCMEYLHLVQNLDWLRDELGDYQDDYLIIDCPGQIELYTHFPHMRLIAEALQQWDYSVCAVWLIDSHFIDETSKFLSASLTSLSAMLQLGVPHVNVLTKMDLLGKKAQSSKLDKYFELDTVSLLSDLGKETGPRFAKLNEAMATLLDEYNLVSFLPLNITDPDSLTTVLSHIDSATQYGEDLEPRDPYEGIDENEEDGPGNDE